MDKQEYLNRLVFCCARVPIRLDLNDDIRYKINISVLNAMLSENRSSSKSNLNTKDIREFLRDLNLYLSGDYYGFTWPQDYTHLIQEGKCAIMHHEWIEWDGKHDVWDFEHVELLDDSDKTRLNQYLIESFPREFDSNGDACNLRWDGDTVSDKHYAACQFIREEIIEKHICKIASGVSFDYADLIISIPREVERLIPHYIKLIINLAAEKSPNTKVRVSFSLFDADTIAESCKVRWNYLGFTFEKVPDIDEILKDGDSIESE